MTMLIVLMLAPIAISALPHLLPGAKVCDSELAKKQRELNS